MNSTINKEKQKKVRLLIGLIMMVELILFMLPIKINANSSDFVIKNGILEKYKGSSKNVVIPNSVRIIGEKAFAECSSITNITIPDKVTKIESLAFLNCTKLAKITLSNKITSIEDGAFYNCISLKAIKLPDSLSSLGSQAFKYCKKLAEITIPKSLKVIGAGAFEKTAWYSAKTKKSPFLIVNKILCDASKCKGKVTVPKGVIEIGDSAFYRSSVTEVVLQEGVKVLGDNSLAVRSLENVILPEGLTEIGVGAFFETKIQSITIPNSVTSIGSWAFYECYNLESIDIPDRVTKIDFCTFLDCSKLKKVSIPKSVVDIDYEAFLHANALNEIEVDPDNPKYVAEGTFLLSKDKKELLYCQKSSGDIIIPEGVEKIAKDIFSNYEITSVKFPSTFRILSDNLFHYNSDLTEIIIPSSLTSFGEQNLVYTKIKSIQVYQTDDPANYTSENGTLYNADKTTLICDPTAEKTVVSDTVTSIGSYAFPKANLSITIPKTVNTLGDKLFYYEMKEGPSDKSSLTVYGSQGSAMEKYCNEHKINFEVYNGI